MPDRKSQKEDRPSVIPKEPGDDAQLEKTIRGVHNLVEALCEEPFEAEIEDEDVSDLKAALMSIVGDAQNSIKGRAGNQEPPIRKI